MGINAIASLNIIATNGSKLKIKVEQAFINDSRIKFVKNNKDRQNEGAGKKKQGGSVNVQSPLSSNPTSKS